MLLPMSVAGSDGVRLADELHGTRIWHPLSALEEHTLSSRRSVKLNG